MDGRQPGHDDVYTLLCVSAWTGPNATGDSSGRHCRAAENLSRGFNFTVDYLYDPAPGGYQSVVVELGYQYYAYGYVTFEETRTRNRPA